MTEIFEIDVATGDGLVRLPAGWTVRKIENVVRDGRKLVIIEAAQEPPAPVTVTTGTAPAKGR